METSYQVSELFTSIQGEGEVIGIPSHFIRLYRCDLTCSWCDSKYTWVRQDHAVEGKDFLLMGLGEILAWLEKEPRASLVTITGGEPMLQPILPLVAALGARDYQVVVETNGRHTPDQVLLDLVHYWAVSPKLRNAGTEVQWGPLDWLGKARNFYLKFVVCDPAIDLPEVQEFVERRGISNSKVILQPDGIVSDYEIALRRLADLVRERGSPYRVLPQLHRILWGLQRGI